MLETHLRTAEAAKRIRVSIQELYNLEKCGAIPCERVRGRLWFSTADLDAYVRDTKTGDRDGPASVVSESAAPVAASAPVGESGPLCIEPLGRHELSAREVSEFLRISRPRVYALAQADILQGFKRAGRWCFDRDDVARYRALCAGGIVTFSIARVKVHLRGSSPPSGLHVGEDHNAAGLWMDVLIEAPGTRVTTSQEETSDDWTRVRVWIGPRQLPTAPSPQVGPEV